MPKKPPLQKPSLKKTDLNKLDKFAGAVEVEVNDKPKYSWKQPGVRKDVVKGMGVPLSEPYLLKLRFIAENTKWSQRKFCQARLEKAIDREVRVIIRALEGGQPYWSEPDQPELD